jgi:hypothetical protein
MLRAVTNKRKAAVDGATCKADSVAMMMGRTTVRMRALRGNAPGLPAQFGDLLRALAKALLDPYRPELHYMRGPGPKWRAKHAPAPTQQVRAIPLLALIRLPISARRSGR